MALNNLGKGQREYWEGNTPYPQVGDQIRVYSDALFILVCSSEIQNLSDIL